MTRHRHRHRTNERTVIYFGKNQSSRSATGDRLMKRTTTEDVLLKRGGSILLSGIQLIKSTKNRSIRFGSLSLVLNNEQRQCRMTNDQSEDLKSWWPSNLLPLLLSKQSKESIYSIHGIYGWKKELLWQFNVSMIARHNRRAIFFHLPVRLVFIIVQWKKKGFLSPSPPLARFTIAYTSRTEQVRPRHSITHLCPLRWFIFFIGVQFFFDWIGSKQNSSQIVCLHSFTFFWVLSRLITRCSNVRDAGLIPMMSVDFVFLCSSNLTWTMSTKS